MCNVTAWPCVGAIALDGLDQAERFALAGLLGRPVTESRVGFDLAILDRRLRESRAARGLMAAVDQLRGPLVDRHGERAARGARREALWTELRAGWPVSGSTESRGARRGPSPSARL